MWLLGVISCSEVIPGAPSSARKTHNNQQYNCVDCSNKLLLIDKFRFEFLTMEQVAQLVHSQEYEHSINGASNNLLARFMES